LEEELIRRAEKAERKAKEREEFIKNSGINIRQKSKPKVTKAQIREIKKQQQRDLEKEHALNVDRGPVKTALELAFENVYGHIHSWKFDGYPPLDRLHKIQYTPG